MLSNDARIKLIGLKGRLLKGWRKGKLGVSTDEVCIHGGIIMECGIPGVRAYSNGRGSPGRTSAPYSKVATCYDMDADPIAVEMRTALEHTAGVDPKGLPLWQDAPERTLEEVVDLIDRTLDQETEPSKERAAGTAGTYV